MTSSREEGILSVDSLQTQAATPILPWVTSLLAYHTDFGLATFQNHVSLFLKIKDLPIYLSIYLSVYLSIYLSSIFCQEILFILFFWRLVHSPRDFSVFWTITFTPGCQHFVYVAASKMLCVLYIFGCNLLHAQKTTHIIHFEIFISQCTYCSYSHIRLPLHPTLCFLKVFLSN